MFPEKAKPLMTMPPDVEAADVEAADVEAADVEAPGAEGADEVPPDFDDELQAASRTDRATAPAASEYRFIPVLTGVTPERFTDAACPCLWTVQSADSVRGGSSLVVRSRCRLLFRSSQKGKGRQRRGVGIVVRPRCRLPFRSVSAVFAGRSTCENYLVE